MFFFQWHLSGLLSAGSRFTGIFPSVHRKIKYIFISRAYIVDANRKMFGEFISETFRILVGEYPPCLFMGDQVFIPPDRITIFTPE